MSYRLEYQSRQARLLTDIRESRRKDGGHKVWAELCRSPLVCLHNALVNAVLGRQALKRGAAVRSWADCASEEKNTNVGVA